MDEQEEEMYQYYEIVCECGHDYNEDKTLYDLLEKIEYEAKIQCPKCGKINNLSVDYPYIDEIEDEQMILYISNSQDKRKSIK